MRKVVLFVLLLLSVLSVSAVKAQVWDTYSVPSPSGQWVSTVYRDRTTGTCSLAITNVFGNIVLAGQEVRCNSLRWIQEAGSDTLVSVDTSGNIWLNFPAGDPAGTGALYVSATSYFKDTNLYAGCPAMKSLSFSRNPIGMSSSSVDCAYTEAGTQYRLPLKDAWALAFSGFDQKDVLPASATQTVVLDAEMVWAGTNDLQKSVIIDSFVPLTFVHTPSGPLLLGTALFGDKPGFAGLWWTGQWAIVEQLPGRKDGTPVPTPAVQANG